MSRSWASGCGGGGGRKEEERRKTTKERERERARERDSVSKRCAMHLERVLLILSGITLAVFVRG